MHNDNGKLCSSARAVFDRCVRKGSSDVVIKELLEDHLIGIQEWVPKLLAPMPFSTVDLEIDAYQAFVTVFFADMAEYAGKSSNMAVVSPSHFMTLHRRYTAALEAVASMGWHLSATCYVPASTEGQRTRKRASEVAQQEILESLLRSILPPEHFEAIQAIGIDAADWHEKRSGLAFGAKSHRDDIVAKGNDLASQFRFGRRERSPQDAVFVRDLAKIFAAGCQSNPISWHNPTTETNSLFYEFVGAAWKVGRPEICPSADTISDLLNSENTQ